MIINQGDLYKKSPILGMDSWKTQGYPTSYGLSEGGYDIRLKQDISFFPTRYHVTGTPLGMPRHSVDGVFSNGNFALASAIEEFTMPNDLIGFVFNKSTWARQGLNVFTTVIEPGWKGFLTLELSFHGSEQLHIPAACGIAQVVFCQLSQASEYMGKYQHQADMPMPAR